MHQNHPTPPRRPLPAGLSRLLLTLLALAVMLAPGRADAQAPETTSEGATPAGPAAVVTQPIYKVDAFSIAFDRDVTASGVSQRVLLNQPLRLSKVGEVYTRPQSGAPIIETTLAQLKGEAKQYDVTALRAVLDDTLAYLNDEANLIGIVVAPDPRDIGIDLSDRREGRTGLTILIRAAAVGNVRTLASGDRIDHEERENHPLHKRIRDRSPLKPAMGKKQPASLLKRDKLDAYLYRLNRHPGRRVDAAVSPGMEVGEVSLDYLVAENKPWYTYFQLSNTGTDSTNELRERFGFVHNQLTNADDTFILDYITAGFDDSHVVTIGYERPLTERISVRLDALWSEFTADQVGSTLPFTGEDASFGGSLVLNFFQKDALFLDLVGGLEYYYTSAQNPAAGLDGEENLLMGSLGVEMERVTDLSQLRGLLRMRGNLNQAKRDEFNALGRTNPDTQFMVIQYALTGSFYLEPLLNRAAWEDISDPSTSTLAHEIALGVRGQWAPTDDRLVPTFQAVAGGLYTVRGYDQSEVAGDSSMIMSAEYRFHVPRIFGIQAPKRTAIFDRPFRVAPESVYGRPDWDFVLKAFVDYAVIDTSKELAFETDETMLSTGLGFEVALKNNVNFRGEWGFALQDAGATEEGDSEFHFVLTLLY